MTWWDSDKILKTRKHNWYFQAFCGKLDIFEISIYPGTAVWLPVLLVVVDDVALQRLLLLRPTAPHHHSQEGGGRCSKIHPALLNNLTLLKQFVVITHSDILYKNVNFSRNIYLWCWVCIGTPWDVIWQCVARVSQWDSLDRIPRTIWQLTKVTRVILIGTIQSQEQPDKQHTEGDNTIWSGQGLD